MQQWRATDKAMERVRAHCAPFSVIEIVSISRFPGDSGHALVLACDAEHGCLPACGGFGTIRPSVLVVML